MRMSRLILAAMLPVAISAQQPANEPAELSGRLREIRIDVRDIFPGENPRPLEELVDALHWTTREHTIRCEFWFAPGDVVDSDDANELERNLRALDLFAEVSVRLVPAAVPGEVDLEVRTRDRLTLSFGGGASFVGGVTGVNAAVGESNLFGSGDRLIGTFRRNSMDEYRWALAYTDLHVFDSWHTATVQLGSTDDGDFAGIDVRKPFKHLTDPRAYGGGASYDETATDYYRGGDSVAEVPDVRTSARGDIAWGDGPADRRQRLGFFASYEQHDYEAARGPLAAQVRVPGDTWWVRFGPTARWEHVHDYRKVDGLDTLAYVQDLTLGTNVGVSAGARWREEDGAGSALEPEVALDADWATELLPRVFTHLLVRGGVRWDGGDAVGWNATTAGRAYWAIDDSNTLCARAVFDAVEETQDLAVELTLGEDNGLRGYPAREFAGTRRVRANVEHRYDTGLEFATGRFGLVAFYDNGWIGSGSDLGSPISSAGAGLRIGSKPLLGGGVVRIDFAKPFERAPGEDRDWTVSVSVGQVFTF
jgi:hypothetical protein